MRFHRRPLQRQTVDVICGAVCVIYLLLSRTKAAAATAQQQQSRLDLVVWERERVKQDPNSCFRSLFVQPPSAFGHSEGSDCSRKTRFSAAKPQPLGKRRCQTRHRWSKQSSRRGGGSWHRNDTLHSSLFSALSLKISSPTSDEPLAKPLRERPRLWMLRKVGKVVDP